jgi:CO/xanthine dehydrogenase Mo-binding subunit
MDIQVPAKPKRRRVQGGGQAGAAPRTSPGKCSGTGDFVTDVRVPGMLHARVIRPPRAACKIRGVDESSIKGIRGVQVVREKDFVAVVAPREWDAGSRRAETEGRLAHRSTAHSRKWRSSTTTSGPQR